MIVNVKQTKKAAQARAAYRRRRDRCMDAGICLQCKAEKEDKTRLYCNRCDRERKEIRRFKYLADKEIGLCTICEKAEARPGKTLCLACALKQSEYNLQRKVR